MKIKITVISGILLAALIIWGVNLYINDPLQGIWQSDKGDGYGLIEVKGAPFILEFKKDTFIFQNKEYKIIKYAKKEDGRIFITTDKFTIKLRFKKNGKIIFAFPGIGVREYKKSK